MRPDKGNRSSRSSAARPVGNAIRLVWFVLLALSYPVSLAACLCKVEDEPFDDSYRDASLVFAGTARSRAPSTWHVGVATDGYAYTFAVDRLWKGHPASEYEVLTGRGNGDCGYPFELGAAYLVYAFPDEWGTPMTHLCTRTRPIELAEDDMAALGRPSTIIVVNRVPSGPIAIVGAIGLLFLGGLVGYRVWRPPTG